MSAPEWVMGYGALADGPFVVYSCPLGHAVLNRHGVNVLKCLAKPGAVFTPTPAEAQALCDEWNGAAQ